ncbi:TlpA family protein disulfide reductase [Allomuricauda sp. F6463D]|uniref:TlpA family protein disulfide reductase n=1 Tax=Allomuricauda sp. F6463D TaxID=2926409 RepID=UPI001FF6B751|nr:TlpA disulfide reductase family protein [Muricauda sp. F6463D]
MNCLLKPLVLIFLLLQSCTEEPWLSGTLNMSDGDEWKPMVYVVHPQKFNELAQSFVGIVLDSAEVDSNGYFEFKESPDYKEPVLLEIVVQKIGEKYPNRLINENHVTDNYFPLIYTENANLEVKAAIASFQSSLTIANPSPANEAVLRLRDERLTVFDKYLKEVVKGQQADEDLLEREKSLHLYQEKLVYFADSTSHLLPALMALRWVSPEGDYERIAEPVYQQSKKWNELYPEHPWVKEFVSVANKQNLPVLIGDTIPNLKFPMKSGVEISLKEIIEGQKLVLLDVWASWCAPCRVENRNVLVPLWEKYNPENFQIVAYGLESSEKAWHNAIEKDGAYRWLHASHLEGDQNPLMEDLRLKTIPANFIIDSEGKVLAKNLLGKDLTDFVDGYMSK